MLTLYTFGPKIDLPDPSAFCMKGEILLRMAGLDYKLDTTGFNKAPKGKLPYLDDNGTVVADSTLIRWHLEQHHKVDFDPGLSKSDQAAAWAFEKMAEDHLYWAMVWNRWVDDVNFNAGPRQFFDEAPAMLRPLIIAKVRHDVRRNLKGQGLGRHTPADIERMAIHGINAIADQLGEKAFLMGERPCGADASIFGTVASFLCPHFDGAILRAAQARPTLTAYRDRGLALWFPNFVAKTAKL
jgi:glutathione S-transferase